MSAIAIRHAGPGDHAAIRTVETAAFPSPAEADLVEALRAAGDAVLELVAETDGRIVGHLLFSRLWVEAAGRRFAAVALAPVAVHPDRQAEGVGSALIEEAHRRLRRRERLSVVLGEPAYYRRFGYERARAAGFDSDYQGDFLQALAWGDAPVAGRLVYAPAFGGL